MEDDAPPKWGKIDESLHMSQQIALIEAYVRERQLHVDMTGEQEQPDNARLDEWIKTHSEALRQVIHRAWGSSGDSVLADALTGFIKGTPGALSADEFEVLLAAPETYQPHTVH